MKKKIIYSVILILFIAAIFFIINKVNLAKNNSQKSNDNGNAVLRQSSSTTQDNIDYEEDFNVVADMNNLIEIKEKMFISQIDDININLEEYVDSTIKLEGYIYNYKDETDDKEYHYVLRNTPGCCGTDGQTGFEIRGNIDFPEDDEWVEVTGVLKAVDEGYYYGKIPVIYVTNLEIKQERGADFVTQ